MANTPKNYSDLDAFLQQVGAPTNVQAPKPAPKAKGKAVKGPNAPENQAYAYQATQAYGKAAEAAINLKQVIAKWQGGIASKDAVAAAYQAYTDAGDKLSELNQDSAANIQSTYFPGVQGSGTQSGGSQQLRYGINGESLVPGTPEYQKGLTTPVAPTLVFDKNGNPVKNPDGSYKTAVGSTAPNATKTSASGNKETSGSGSLTQVSSTELNNRKINEVPVGPVSQESAMSTWADQYGGIGAMALTIPWMKTLLAQAAKGGWAKDKFTNAVKNYRDNTGQHPWDNIAQAYRDSSLAYYDNKQAWGQQYNDKLDILQKSAIAQGLDPSVFGTKIDVNDSKAIDAAYKDQHNGINTFFNVYYNNMPDQGTVDKYVSNHTSLAKTDQGVYAGVIGQNAQALTDYAESMGISPMLLPSKQGSVGDYFANAAKAIQDGTTTMVEQQNYIKEQAIATYAPFANRIKEGMSVKSLASPYLNAAANLLETTPDKIDLGATSGLGFDITKALQGDGTAPMALDKFMTQVKQRPEWLQTTNARDSLMGTATSLLRNFGMITGG